MGEGGEWNPQWWLEAKAANLERRRRSVAPTALARPGDAFLIVTEGTVTEPVYFDLLLRDLQLSVVRIKVLPGDASDPRHVIRTAEQVANRQLQKARRGQLGIHEPEKFDHVWAVLDTDVATRQQFWNEVQQLAEACKVKLAYSTPCFEFWLLLHISGFTTRSDLVDGDAAKRAVKQAICREYSTNEEVAQEVIPTFFGQWPEAVSHAERVRRHHETVATPQPANPSTAVDRLVRALNDSAPEHLRKIRQ